MSVPTNGRWTYFDFYFSYGVLVLFNQVELRVDFENINLVAVGRNRMLHWSIVSPHWFCQSFKNQRRKIKLHDGLVSPFRKLMSSSSFSTRKNVITTKKSSKRLTNDADSITLDQTNRIDSMINPFLPLIRKTFNKNRWLEKGWFMDLTVEWNQSTQLYFRHLTKVRKLRVDEFQAKQRNVPRSLGKRTCSRKIRRI